MAEDTALDAAAGAREVRYLHAAFFRRDLPPEIVDRYVSADRLCVPSDMRSRQRMLTIVSRQLDVESIELALRWRRLDSTLTRKIQILFYLVEVRADYYGYFINQDSGPLRASIALAGSALRTLWRFAKGMYLIRRYGLA